MCGIVGLVNLNQEKAVTESSLRLMSDSIIRRGPDDEGFFIDKNVGLGFRRLSIIDLHTGHQPILNEDDSVSIIFNGEIYNFQDLRKILVAKGHIFKTYADTEVILHAYEEFGDECVNYLRGMFGFAIWDKKKKRLFCARDRFGIKPFHYYFDSEKFLLASEIKAILKVDGVNKTLSNEAIDCYFTYGYIIRDLSIYQNIKQLLPGHTLTLDLSGKSKVQINRYWDINFEPDYSKTEDQWKEELESTLSECVKMHMVSDVPLGAFLSGGIDSSSVVSLMSKYSQSPIKTFSIGFKESKYNELHYAEDVAKKYGTEHYTHIVEPESIDQLLPVLVSSYDAPFSDASAIPTHIVSKFARQYVTVVLSGDGGDELFCGYDHYPQMAKIQKMNFNSAFLSDMVWGNINRLMPGSFKGKNLTYYLSKNKKIFPAYYSLFNLPERNKILSNDFIAQLDNKRAEHLKEDLLFQNSGHDFLSRVQKLDMQTYMVDDILTKVDRVSMHNSLEVRVPILDHLFAELSFKIPNTLKLKGANTKYIFKESMRKHLPPSILAHKKQGFGVPMEYWFRSELKEYIDSKITASNSKLTKYLDMKNIRALISDHNKGMRNLSSRIWSILVFDEWLNQNEVD
jgi:asparagine synthase (glutamine-hydrolysing)